MTLYSVMATLAFASILLQGKGRIHTFLEPGERSVDEVERSLALELAGNVNESHVKTLEGVLQATYKALPKTIDGHLGAQAVRYVLHRYFQQRGWYVKGLEPGNDTASWPSTLHSWAPVFLQSRLKERLGGKGIDLHDLAALTATLEDIAAKEAVERLREVYETYELTTESPLNMVQVDNVLTTFFQIFVRGIYREGRNMTIIDKNDAVLKRENFHRIYKEWGSAKQWLDRAVQESLGSNSFDSVPFAAVKNVALKIIESFGLFNDAECQDLKHTLMSMEITTNGRMPLATFYKGKRHSHWAFKEKREYLRTLGALDESNASMPMVIMTNYYMIRSNCIESTNLFAVCCRNECEDLLGHLEQEIKAPEAAPERIVNLITHLSSASSPAPQNLSATVIFRLQEIAAMHGGSVQLHGRLFAQWLHHVFPHECPYPHEAGTTSPMTPDEWIQVSGQTSFTYNSAELSDVMDEVCYSSGCTNEPEVGQVEIPWSNVEELLTHQPTAYPKLSIVPKVMTIFALLAMVIAIGTHASSSCGLHLPNRPRPSTFAALALMFAGCLFGLVFIDRAAVICASFGCLLMLVLRQKHIGTYPKKDLEKFSV